MLPAVVYCVIVLENAHIGYFKVMVRCGVNQTSLSNLNYHNSLVQDIFTTNIRGSMVNQPSVVFPHCKLTSLDWI